MLFWTALVFGGIFFAVYGLVQIFHRNKTPKSHTGNDSALEQLKVRFVKGEIGEEEYLERKLVLLSQ